MRDMTDRTEIKGEAIHVGDCYVWAEIYYLDSPTDYREYISNHVLQPSTATGEEFITLHNAGPFSWGAVSKFFVVLVAMLFTPTWQSHRAAPMA
jgi:hypothetical protein